MPVVMILVQQQQQQDDILNYITILKSNHPGPIIKNKVCIRYWYFHASLEVARKKIFSNLNWELLESK